jgi:hypothetical protein
MESLSPTRCGSSSEAKTLSATRSISSDEHLQTSLLICKTTTIILRLVTSQTTTVYHDFLGKAASLSDFLLRGCTSETRSLSNLTYHDTNLTFPDVRLSSISRSICDTRHNCMGAIHPIPLASLVSLVTISIGFVLKMLVRFSRARESHVGRCVFPSRSRLAVISLRAIGLRSLSAL